jgi:outer membrane protein
MLKKLLILFIAIAPIAAIAQVNIAVINAQEVMLAMPELSNIERQMADKQEQLQSTLQVLQTEYNNMLRDFETLPETTSETIRQDRINELIQLQQRLQTFVQNSEMEMGQLLQRLLEPLQRRIFDAINAVSSEGGYTFVFDLDTESPLIVHVSDNASNITQAVKTRLGLR